MLKKSLTILLAGLLLASCGPQGTTSTPTSAVDAILTSSVGTISASIFQTQTALVPPPTDTLMPTIAPTDTPAPVITLPPLSTPTFSVVYTPVIVSSPTPTGTQYTATPNPSALSYGCNNLALINDKTIPAGTVVKPREKFTKTWQVSNTGTCNWVYQYQLVFQSGDKLGGSPATLGKVIEPGKWTQISVNLTAPSDAGTYTGYWRFSDSSGHAFGATLSVSIVVGSPTNTPAPADTNTPEPATSYPNP